MKKLVALIGAVAMGFGLFADDSVPFATSFEAGEAGVEGATFTPGTGWEWSGDPLALGAYAGDAYTYGTGDYARRFDGAQTQYLQLETGDKALSRDLGAGNTTVDQLVQFTGYDAPLTEFAADAKIAVWMLGTENTDDTPGETNLYVTCGAETNSLKLVAPAGTVWQTEKWYRLTVKSLGPDATGREQFNIYIDGQLLSSEGQDTQTVFPSMSATEPVTKMKIQGIGAIDDLTIDADGPLFTQAVEFTVELPANVASATVTGADQTATGWKAKNGAAIAITYTAAEGYLFNNGQSTITVNTTAAKGTIAATDDVKSATAAEAKIGTVYYLTLQDALDVGGYITLLKNVMVNETLVVKADTTIDLDGYIGDGDWEGGYGIYGTGLPANAWLINVGDKSLTILNGGDEWVSSDQRGILVDGGTLVLGADPEAYDGDGEYDDVEVVCAQRAIGAYRGATVIIRDCSMAKTTDGDNTTIFIFGVNDKTTTGTPSVLTVDEQASVVCEAPGATAIMGSGNDWTGTAVTIDGTVTSADDIAIYFPGAGTLTVNDGAVITGKTAIYAKAGTIDIKGGTIIGNKDTLVEFDPNNNNGAPATGDAIVLEKLASGEGGYSDALACEIKGGTIESAVGMVVRSVARTGSEPLAGFIEGGKFKGLEMPVEYIAAKAGKEAKWSAPDASGYVSPTWVDLPAIAKVTIEGVPTEYADLHEALVAGSAKGALVELIDNVDLKGENWEPIESFAGTFDGKGYKISNLTIADESGTEGIGLIKGSDTRQETAGAMIRNVTFENVSIDAPNSTYVGTVGGSNQFSGMISNVTVCGTIQIVGFKYVGGICGHSKYGDIVDCHVDGGDKTKSFIGQAAEKTAEGQVGGICGMTAEGNKVYRICNCSVMNVAMFGNERVGGVVGRIYGTQVIGCSAENLVLKGPQGADGTGGLIGVSKDNGVMFIINSTTSNIELYDLNGDSVEYTEIGSKERTIVGTDVEAECLNFAPKKRFGFTAGTFTPYGKATASDVNDECAIGYVAVDNGDGTYTVKKVWDVTLINGETTVDTQTVIDGECATNVTLDVEGFKGWTNETYATGFDFTTPIAADLTLYAWIEAAAPWSDVEKGEIEGITEENKAAVEAQLDAIKAALGEGADEAAVGGWLTKVYGNQKVPAADVIAANNIAISVKYDLPLMANDPEIEVAKDEAVADGFTFTIKDGEKDVSVAVARVEEIVKYSDTVDGTFAKNTEKIAVTPADTVIKANFKKPNNEAQGFMKAELK